MSKSDSEALTRDIQHRISEGQSESRVTKWAERMVRGFEILESKAASE